MPDQEAYFVVSPETGTSKSSAPLKMTCRTEVTTLECEDARIGELISKVDILTQEVEDLISLIKDAGIVSPKDITSSKVIIVEEMDKSTAKQRVFDFIREHKTSDIEELHENIKCDIRVLTEIIDELCAEGAILGE